MVRVYKDMDEVEENLEYVPGFDSKGKLRMDIYLDGKKIGCHDGGNQKIRLKVRLAEDECPTVPKAPPGVGIDENIREAKKHWSPWWFKRQVKEHGPWDYKQQDLEKYEDFGNFNYGATGMAIGVIPEGTLLREAGRYHKEKNPDSPQGGKPGIFGIPFDGVAPYNDDEKDQAMIKKGIKYYKCKFKR